MRKECLSLQKTTAPNILVCFPRNNARTLTGPAPSGLGYFFVQSNLMLSSHLVRRAKSDFTRQSCISFCEYAGRAVCEDTHLQHLLD